MAWRGERLYVPGSHGRQRAEPADAEKKPGGHVSQLELPGDAASGYLHASGLRTNVLHLPVRGTGDGGVHSTVDDLHAFWAALFDGRLLPAARVEQLVTPRHDWPEEHRRYGLGIHLDAVGDGVFMEGSDAGVSMASRCVPSSGLTWTVVSNWTEGAWPVVRGLLNGFPLDRTHV